MRRIAIVGGGITGLTAAYRLLRLRESRSLDLEVVLLEGSERLGGKIKTDRSAGVVIEAGPDSFLTAKPDAVELARELGLGERLLPTAEGAHVYVYLRGRLRRLPDGLMLMAPTKVLPFLRSDLMSLRGKLRMGLDVLVPRGAAGDESLADFTRRRLGAEALEAIVDPLMAGIYAGDAEAMSLQSTFPQFVELERRYGSVIRGLRAGPRAARKPGALTAFASFRNGVSELVEALAGALGGAVKAGAPVRSVGKSGAGFRLEWPGGGLEADQVLLAVGAAEAAGLVEGLGPGLAPALRELTSVSTATVTLGFERRELPELPKGFGFVIPKSAGRTINAATFVSQKFQRSAGGPYLIRCFLGGAGKEGTLERSDQELQERALADLREIAAIRATPKLARIYRWSKANPQYNVGHAARMKKIEEELARLPGLSLAGASYYGVGIPDCIRSANITASRIAS